MCVCVCLMVFISAGHVYTPVSAASRCTFPAHSVKQIYGCSLSALHDLSGFGGHSFPTTHFSSAADSRHIPYRGRSERSHRATWDTGRGKPKDNCPVEELTARKHGIINLPSCYNAVLLFSLHVCRCYCVAASLRLLACYSCLQV